MAALHIFKDLPSIDIDDGPFNSHPAYHANGADVESFWAPMNPRPTYLRDVPVYDSELSLEHGNLQALSCAQPLPMYFERPSFISEGSTWPNDTAGLNGHLFGVWAPQRLQEGQNPWPQAVEKARYSSPDGSMGGDRSATEQDSSTGGSIWSPRRSVDLREARHPEPTEDFDTHCLPGTPSQDHGSAPPHVGYSSFHNYPGPANSSFGAGVALRDVQEFADSESEEHMEQFDEPDMKTEHPFQLEFARPHGCQQEDMHARRNYDEGIGSSIHDDDSPCASTKVEDDGSMVDDIKEEGDDDDASDYSPSSRSKRNYHTRKSSLTNSLSPPTKRSSRSKRSPKLPAVNKISKRRTKSTPITPTFPLNPIATTPTSTNGNKACPNCAQTFATPSAMHKHNLTTHTRPFTCTFMLYGCPSRFGSKNEWKRHVSSQHIQLGVWRCDQGACIPRASHPRSPASMSKKKAAAERQTETDENTVVVGGTAVEVEGGWKGFNRKDLFTQHLRRMHSPAASASQTDKAAFENSLEGARRRCWIKTREPPQVSVCGYCCGGAGRGREGVFEGSGSWDERMEHVGRHLEGGRAEREWREDVGLREWMVREGLIVWEEKGRRWVLVEN